MKIIENPSLKTYTTLNIGGIAHKEYLLEHKEDVEQIPTLLAQEGLPYILLGGGSNVLIDDKKLECILLRDMIDSKNAIEILEEEENFVYLKIPSGMYLPLFIQYCKKHGFSGLEGLAGIPGRMGGALAMNAGAFATQVEDVFLKASVFSPEYGLVTHSKEDFDFKYRSTKLKRTTSYTIYTDMTFKMKKTTPELVSQTIDENFLKKKISQPLKDKTAGCAFKNPSGFAAGKLIQDIGLKGYRLNDMGFSNIHANFLVNYGKGSYEDALKVLTLAQERVLDTFGLRLDTEIKILSSQTY